MLVKNDLSDLAHRYSRERFDAEATQRRPMIAQRYVGAALRAGRLKLAWQPVFDAAKSDVLFYEGLMRVVCLDGEIIAAGQFMPGIESSEVGRAVDTLALSTAIQELTQDSTVTLSVNASPRSLLHYEWLHVLFSGIEHAPEIASRLIIEITERSALKMTSNFEDCVSHIQYFGVRIALDDFGSGYASLGNIQLIGPDIVKLSGDFVKGIANSRDKQVAVRAFLSVALHHGARTVAEGIETDADLEWVKAAGFDGLQGFALGRPSFGRGLPSSNELDSKRRESRIQAA